MTKIDLQRVLDLDAQATAGPWEDCVDPEGANEDWRILQGRGRFIADLLDGRNAELIAYYRAAAPAMAKALNAVLGAIEVLREDNPREPVLLNALGILEGFIEKHLGGQE